MHERVLTKNFNMFIVLFVHNVYVRVGWLLSEMPYYNDITRYK